MKMHVSTRYLRTEHSVQLEETRRYWRLMKLTSWQTTFIVIETATTPNSSVLRFDTAYTRKQQNTEDWSAVGTIRLDIGF